jgi:hypothetical protein
MRETLHCGEETDSGRPVYLPESASFSQVQDHTHMKIPAK